MAGHLIDRSGMPHLIARFGRDGMAEVAISEWRAASPNYAPRMQRLLGFTDPTVASIFKGMQLDIGAPPEFLDFRYEITDDNHGGFHLDHCGALMDVEPMGEDYVSVMCHDIEDPTFDATAAASNPRARMEPIHRPPRSPADRQPHCAWTVTIHPEADPLPFPAEAVRLADSAAAQLPLPVRPDDLAHDDGWNDYRGPLDADLVMERFSSATIAALCDEVALQGHLLSRAYLLEVADRVGDDVVPVGIEQASGIAGLAAKRLAAALGATADLTGLAAVLDVHPVFHPRTYVDLRMSPVDDPADPDSPDSPDSPDGSGGPAGPGGPGGGAYRVALGSCPALDEPDGLTWPALVAGPGGQAVLDAVAACVVPTARVLAAAPEGDERAAWIVVDRPDLDPVDQPSSVTLTEFSTGATFAFTRRT